MHLVTLLSATTAVSLSLFSLSNHAEPRKESLKKDAEIRPFHVRFSDQDLADLRRRINATRWPERKTVKGTSHGVPLAAMQDPARYWGKGYDWRKAEAKLNAIPQFVTNIDGLEFILSTFALAIQTPCRSSSLTDGPVPSLSS